MSVDLRLAIPTFRMFDVEKAKDFYLGFLGFKLDWEHRFEPDLPLYMRISRGDVKLHLSEHHGDGCPGAIAFVQMSGIEEYHREINSKGYKYMRPGLQDQPWGKCMNVIDPAGNQLRFNEPE